MAALSKGVALSFGLVTASVSVHGAIEAKQASGNVLVCDAGHDPVKITQPRTCEHCGPIPFQQAKRAVPTEGGFVVLSDEDLTSVKAAASELTKRAALAAYPAEQVDMQTDTGEKAYFLVPDPGHEAAYAVIRSLVAAHPELAFLAQWTPRAAVGTFQLRVVDSCLALRERIDGGRLKATPEVHAEAPEGVVALAEQILLLPGSISAFNPDTYRDTYHERVAALIEGRKVVQVDGAAREHATGNVATVIDLRDVLERQLKSAKATSRKRATTGRKSA